MTGATVLSYQDIDWSHTRAVAMGYLGQVYLNVCGHRPTGVIAAECYVAERDRLRRLLAELRDPRTGTPIVENVFTREEIYSGEQLTNGPDLVVKFCEGYSGDSGFSGSGKLVTKSPPNHSSDHWNESVFLALGERVRPGEVKARLEDIAPTVLYALGVEVRDDYDGKALPIFV